MNGLSLSIYIYMCVASVFLLFPIIVDYSNYFHDFMHFLLIWHTAINAVK